MICSPCWPFPARRRRKRPSPNTCGAHCSWPESMATASPRMTQRDRALTDLQAWVAAGKLKVQEDIVEGLENTPRAVIGLLAGDNRGKRMVKV